MDPYIVMISAIPLTFQLKVNLILTIAIALDRVLALYVPVRYRMISSLRFAAVALVLATKIALPSFYEKIFAGKKCVTSIARVLLHLTKVTPRVAQMANRSSTSFLLSSLVCLTVPSVIVGGAELFGFSLFEYIGPFYLVGLLCANCMNCIVYALFNSEIRLQMRRCAIDLRSNSLSFAQKRCEIGSKSTSNISRTHRPQH
ncbi:unnamed protein product [Strongylus vulgaris]|uniref:G-protein coupled receptors family 1 profile domain-containing protein n=1 Tax=Strongylus vulgaris TaxID=40348 RepID=A0A3P7LB54_STRVU|nr:unnamed protein product [Strongylus vulgaris]